MSTKILIAAALAVIPLLNTSAYAAVDVNGIDHNGLISNGLISNGVDIGNPLVQYGTARPGSPADSRIRVIAIELPDSATPRRK